MRAPRKAAPPAGRLPVDVREDHAAEPGDLVNALADLLLARARRPPRSRGQTARGPAPVKESKPKG